MMAVQQRAVSVIEEVLISDSEDDEVVIVDDDNDQTNKFEETKEFIHAAIDYECSSKGDLYNNGDFEHLPQLFANRSLRKTEEIYLDEEYDISDASNDASNHSSNEVINNVNSSDKENVPVQDPARIENNDRSADSDDDQFYIAEDCNTKDVLNHAENNENMDVDVDIVSFSSNHKEIKINVNASNFKEDHKSINTNSPKCDSAGTDVDKLVIDESTTNVKEEATSKLQETKLEPEELMNETSSDDDSEDAQDGQVLTIPLPYQGLKSSKRLLRMHCKNCAAKSGVPKLHKPDACICKICDSAMDFQCKTCLRGFRTYWAAFGHLKRECAAKYFWHCPECDYAVRDQSKFDQHIQKAHAKISLPCPHCRKCFHNQKVLEKHLETSCPAKVPRFHCNSCDFKERLLSKIKRHVMMSHCVIEGGFTKIDHKMQAKENTTEPRKEYGIDTGDSTIVSNDMEEKLNMEKLIKLHCAKCKITFKKTADIGTKCKYCNGSMHYQCKMCKERSKSLCGIYDHLDNNCEFVICKKCNSRFKTKVDAIKHKEACGRLIFYCKICTFRTKHRRNLELHKSNKHSNKNTSAEK